MAGSFIRSIVRKSRSRRDSISRAVNEWVNAELRRLEEGAGDVLQGPAAPRAASARATEQLEDRILFTGSTPTLTTVTPLTGASENAPFSIPYATLKGASDAADPGNGTIQFRIDAVSNGATLKKNGVAVVPGTTLVTGADTLTWTNPTNTSGTENAFTVEAYNGTNYSGAAVQVSVVVQQVEQPPTITGVNTLTSGTENTPYTITFAALSAAAQGVSDPQGQATSFQVAAITTGTLTKNGVPVNPADNTRNTLNPGESWVWTPAANASGTLNAFTVKSFNGQLASVTAPQVKVTVAAVNQAPTLTSVSALPGATENQGFSITYATLSAASDLSDVDGTTDSFKIAAVSSGTLTKNGVSVVAGTTTIATGDTVVWTPATNASGVVPAFTVQGYDGSLTSNTPIQVNVNVAHVNQPPVLTAVDTFTGATENAPFAITYDALAGSSDVYDVDSSSLSFKIAAVSSGTLTDGSFNPVVAGTTLLRPGGTLYWTPPANTTGNGLNAFTVKANDGTLDSANAVQVKVTVGAVSYAPTLTTITTLPGGTEGQALSIPFATLAAASNKASASGAATYFRVESVSGGTLTKSGTAVTPGSTTFNTGDTLVWTPAAYTSGSAVPAFTVRATDGSLLSSTPVQVKVAVAAVHYAPQLTTISTLPGATENQPLTISYSTLLASSDAFTVDGTIPTFQVAAVSTGTLTKGGVAVVAGTTTIGQGESLVWTPAANANGVLNAFTVKAAAGGMTSASAVQVAVDVSHVRQAPVLTALANLPGASENQAYNITYAKMVTASTGNQSDAEGSTVNYQITALGVGTLTQNGIPVQTGAIISSGTTLLWTPPLNASGTGANALSPFSVKATDGALLSATAVPVKVDVTHVDQAPTMTTLSTLTGGTENRAFSIPYATLQAASSAADVDSTVQYRIESVTSGTLTLNGAAVVPGTTAVAPGQTLTWTPAANANGAAVAAFTVKAWDGTLASAAALPVNVALAHVNQAPTLTTISTLSGATENQPFTITYAALTGASNAADVDSTVQFQIAAVSTGTLTKNGVAVVPGTTTIGTGDSVVWTPALNASGTGAGALAAFTLKAYDGSLASPTAVGVLVNVTHVNQAPTLTTIANLTGGTENQPFTVTYAALKAASDMADVDSPTLTFQVQSVLAGTLTKGGQPVVNGTTTLGAGETLLWTPPANTWGAGFAAPGAFTVKASDGSATSPNAIPVKVELANVDQAPTLSTMANFTAGAAATENTPYTFTYANLLAAGNAADIDSWTIGFRVQTVSSGTLTKNGAAVVPGATTISRGDSLVWTPALNANGSAIGAFTVEAYDGTLASSTPVPVTIDVTQVNQPPTLTSVTTVPGATQGQAFTVPNLTTNAADPDSAAVTFRVDTVDDGTLTVNGTAVTPGTTIFNNTTDTVVWTPDAQAHGNVTAYHISAISNGIPSVTSVPVVVAVTPAANTLSYGAAASIAGGTESQPLTITYQQLLTASGAAQTNLWMPLSLRIDSVTAGTLTKNGVAVTPGASGTLVSAGDSIVWTPPTYARGNATAAFVVRAYDGTNNAASTQQITVDLAPVDHPPTLSTVSTLTGFTEDTEKDIPFATLDGAGNAANPDGNPISYRIDSIVNGTMLINGNAVTPGTTLVHSTDTLEYTPGTHLAGSAVPAFTVEASDGTLFSGTPITVNLNIAATAHAPTLTTVATLTTGIENTPLTINYADLLANSDLADVDGGSPMFQVVAVSSGTLTKGGSAVVPGTTTLGPGETWVWTPAANASGNATAAFTVQGWDGALASSTPVQVSVNVAHVPQLPTLTTVSTLTGATENTPYNITYTALNTAGNAANVENDAISYRVESITSGTLTRNGTAVVPGVTLISTGDTVVWTPALNVSGNNLNAFTVRASAGAGVSLTPVQVKVSVASSSPIPTLTNISPLQGGGENLPYTISYSTLLANSDAFDPNGAAVSFQYEATTTGTLTKAGVAMNQGDLISAGDTVVWTPAANASGTLGAFTVQAYDGTNASAAPVQVSVNVAAVDQPPTLSTFTALTGASQNTPFPITYAALTTAGNQTDAAGATINFVIKSVPTGTLTKGGNPVIPGLTRIKAGDTVVWTPPAGQTGTINAFTLVATDGLLNSATPVAVPVTVS